MDLCDGSYSTVKIYPVNGLPDEEKEHGKTKKAIGNFYVQLGGGGSAVYDLPGGALAMVFSADHHTVGVSDGHGGTFFVSTSTSTLLRRLGFTSHLSVVIT